MELFCSTNMFNMTQNISLVDNERNIVEVRPARMSNFADVVLEFKKDYPDINRITINGAVSYNEELKREILNKFTSTYDNGTIEVILR